MCIEKCLHFKRKCRHHPHPILDISPLLEEGGVEGGGFGGEGGFWVSCLLGVGRGEAVCYPPPQQRRSKMIHKQSFPPPHPLLPQNPPLLPQQQLNKMMIQRIELHPPSLHPHPPQFVAAKSLMLNPPNFFLHCILWNRGECVTVFEK